MSKLKFLIVFFSICTITLNLNTFFFRYDLAKFFSKYQNRISLPLASTMLLGSLIYKKFKFQINPQTIKEYRELHGTFPTAN